MVANFVNSGLVPFIAVFVFVLHIYSLCWCVPAWFAVGAQIYEVEGFQASDCGQDKHSSVYRMETFF